jgi:hypothetical protein
VTVDGAGPVQPWFGVRCVFRSGEIPAYEERITVWQAADFDAAVAMAEEEAEAYAADTDQVFLGFAQAYVLPAPPGQGAEVFSLYRDSDLDPDDYLDRFFDTGDERDDSLDED